MVRFARVGFRTVRRGVVALAAAGLLTTAVVGTAGAQDPWQNVPYRPAPAPAAPAPAPAPAPQPAAPYYAVPGPWPH